jgi:3-dehydrosphinganine reductase
MRDRHVLITGGSSGIGLAIARQAAAAGARVSLLARDPQKLSAAAAAVRAQAPQSPVAFTVVADVADEAAVASAVRAAEAAHGPVDVLIASAGVARPGYFAELPVEIFRRAMDVNYFGTLHAIKAVTPSMVARRSGQIVIISSGAGLVGLFGYTAYAPSKFALRGLAESLRAELKPSGVGVTIVYPPDTDTPQLTEENRTKPAETRALTAAAGLWSADDVARVTLAGIRRRTFSITPGAQLTALSWFHGLIAPILRWSFDRTTARASRR